MGKLQTVTTATTEVALEPALRTKLVQRLKIYKGLKDAFEVAKTKLEKEKQNLEGYLEQTGAQSVTVEGYGTLTEVRGLSSKLNKKKFVSLGGSLAMLEDATETTPKRPYILITLPDVEEEE